MTKRLKYYYCMDWLLFFLVLVIIYSPLLALFVQHCRLFYNYDLESAKNSHGTGRG